MIDITEFLGLLALLLGAAIVGGAIVRKFRQPTVLGFLIVGMLIGPHSLGLVEDLEVVNLFAEFGTVLLLFAVGLEFDLNKLRKVGGTAFTAGLVEQATMFLLGYLVGYAIGWSMVESMFLAAILTISSTSICIRMIKEEKLKDTDEGEIVIGTLIVEDLTVILLLVLLSNVVRAGGVNLFSMGIIVLQTITFFILSLGLGLKIVPKILKVVDKLGIDEAPFLTALSLGFSMALLANFLGFSSAIGAFLMGTMIASAPKADTITMKIMPLRDFFATIFFVSFGMLVNPFLIFKFWIISIPIVIIAVFGKILGNFMGSFLAGLKVDSATTVGACMIPRGEFSYVIAKNALDLGVAKAAIYPVTMIVSFITTAIAPLMLRILPTVTPGTIIPQKIFLPLAYVGTLFRSIQNSILRRGKIFHALRTRAISILVDLTLIVAVLSAIGTLKSYLLIVYATVPVFSIISEEIFLLLITVAALSYPILSIFGEIGGLAHVFVSVITDRITFSKHPQKAIYRVIRNILFSLTGLLIFSFISPIISLIAGLKIIAPIMYLAMFSIIVLFILDSLMTINREVKNTVLKSIASESSRAEIERT